jgi:hypothetical protein
MIYTDLKLLIDRAYANFTYDYVNKKHIAADIDYSLQELNFVKVIFKTLLNQVGNESLDQLTKQDIQNCIILLNKFGNQTVEIEYS